MFQNSRQNVQRKACFDFFRFGWNIIVVVAAVGFGNFGNIILLFNNLNRCRFIIQCCHRTAGYQSCRPLAGQSLDNGASRPVFRCNGHRQIVGNIVGHAAGRTGQTESRVPVVKHGRQIQTILIAVCYGNLQNFDADGHLSGQSVILFGNITADFFNIRRSCRQGNCTVALINRQFWIFRDHWRNWIFNLRPDGNFRLGTQAQGRTSAFAGRRRSADGYIKLRFGRQGIQDKSLGNVLVEVNFFLVIFPPDAETGRNLVQQTAQRPAVRNQHFVGVCPVGINRCRRRLVFWSFLSDVFFQIAVKANAQRRNFVKHIADFKQRNRTVAD